MPVPYCHSSDPYLLPCPQFQKIQCLEYNIVVGLHTLLCSFFVVVVFVLLFFLNLTSCQSTLPASLPCHQMELPPILPVCHDIHVSLPEPRKSCATFTILPSFLSKECTSHFFQVPHNLSRQTLSLFFLLLIKNFLLSCGSLTTTFANVLESSHDGCFTVFIKINFLGFYSLSLLN